MFSQYFYDPFKKLSSPENPELDSKADSRGKYVYKFKKSQEDQKISRKYPGTKTAKRKA